MIEDMEERIGSSLKQIRGCITTLERFPDLEDVEIQELSLKTIDELEQIEEVIEFAYDATEYQNEDLTGYIDERLELLGRQHADTADADILAEFERLSAIRKDLD